MSTPVHAVPLSMRQWGHGTLTAPFNEVVSNCALHGPKMPSPARQNFGPTLARLVEVHTNTSPARPGPVNKKPGPMWPLNDIDVEVVVFVNLLMLWLHVKYNNFKFISSFVNVPTEIIYYFKIIQRLIAPREYFPTCSISLK